MSAETASDCLSIHVKNMAGDLLTISCSPHDSLSQIYSAVFQSLEEHSTDIDSVLLLQYDEEKSDYVPLHTLIDDMVLCLVIKEKEYRIEFSSNWLPMTVGRVYPIPQRPLYMEGELFELITVNIYEGNHLFVTFRFVVNFRYDVDDDKEYTDICFHREDINLRRCSPEQYDADDFYLLTIDEDAKSGRTPADLLLDHYDCRDIHLLAKKLETSWMDYLTQQGYPTIHHIPTPTE